MRDHRVVCDVLGKDLAGVLEGHVHGGDSSHSAAGDLAHDLQLVRAFVGRLVGHVSQGPVLIKITHFHSQIHKLESTLLHPNYHQEITLSHDP